MTALIYVDLYQSDPGLKPFATGSRPQRWRWRALNGDNSRILAISSESYTNRQDAVDAIAELFGDTSNVYRREVEVGNVELRLAAAPEGRV